VEETVEALVAALDGVGAKAILRMDG